MIRLGLADDEPLFTMGLAMLLGAQPDMEVVWRAVDGNDALRCNAADPVDVRRCLEKASALSRAIRDTLDDDTRRQLAAREPARARLEALDATCYRIQLARSAHNTDVTQVRSLRGTALVRLFHLAGHAPEPEPIDFDDDTRYDGRGY